MNSHYVIAVLMAIISSTTLVFLLNVVLKKKIKLNETLGKYYGAENLDNKAGGYDYYTQYFGQSISKGVYNYLKKFRIYNSSLDADLAITNGSMTDIALEVVRNIVLSLISCGLITMLIGLGLLQINFLLFLFLALIIVSGLGILPIFSLKQKATIARLNSQTIISAYLDLVSVCLAGGMGLEESLTTNATIGSTVVMAKLKSQFAVSNQFNEPLWVAFSNVAEDLNLPLLKEIASIFKISGSEGAKIKASISRKAQSLREKRLIKEESEANSITERLFLPSVLLLLGFLIFVGYPAVEKIFTGL